MGKTNHFKFQIAERNLENYALPPEDALVRGIIGF